MITPGTGAPVVVRACPLNDRSELRVGVAGGGFGTGVGVLGGGVARCDGARVDGGGFGTGVVGLGVGGRVVVRVGVAFGETGSGLGVARGELATLGMVGAGIGDGSAHPTSTTANANSSPARGQRRARGNALRAAAGQRF